MIYNSACVYYSQEHLCDMHRSSDSSQKNSYDVSITNICWFVRGRIKEKISAIYAIKYQVYCMENTVQWSANTV